MTRAQMKQRKCDDTAARLDGKAVPAGAAWATELRQQSLTRLLEMGLPTKRDEYWKWTDPATLTSAVPTPAEIFDAAEVPIFDTIERLKIVFVDGVFDAAASDDLAGEGVEISLLTDALNADIHWAKDSYGLLEKAGQTPVERPLAAMNTAFATDGVVIRVTGKVAKPISIIYKHSDETSDAILHNLVKLEAGAELTLLENGPAAARFNKVLEVEVADGASFHHVRAQGRDHERRAATHIFARIGANALFKSFTMTANGILTRNEVVLELVGDDSQAHVGGVCMGAGAFLSPMMPSAANPVRCSKKCCATARQVCSKARFWSKTARKKQTAIRFRNRFCWMMTVSFWQNLSWKSTLMMLSVRTGPRRARLMKRHCFT